MKKWLKKNKVRLTIDQFEETIISGWAISTEGNQADVSVYLNDCFLVCKKANLYRQDLKDNGIGTGHHGFIFKNVFKEVAPGTYTVALIANVSKSKSKAKVEKKMLSIDNNRSMNNETKVEVYDSYLQKIEGGSVKGWVWSNNSNQKLDIYIDDLLVDTVLANKFRKDLADKQYADGNISFAYQIEEKYHDECKHVIDVRVHDQDLSLRGSPKNFKLKKDIKLKGNIDTIRSKKILCGWFYPVEESFLYINDTFIDVVYANKYRKDLERAGINKGLAAFEFNIPSKFINGDLVKFSIYTDKSKSKLIAEKKIKTTKYKDYTDYHDYLRWSFFEKEINHPFDEHDKRVLSYMDWRVKKIVTKDIIDRPLVSILMPVFNRRNTLERALTSVLSQSYPEFELIIVDDGSTDESVNFIKTFKDPRIKIIELRENSGASAARNVGLNASTGSYIAYLDSDNSWDPNYLQVMIKVLLDNKPFKHAYCGQYVFNEDNISFVRFGLFNESLLHNRNYIDLNCYVHHIDLFNTCGGFDTSLKRLVDWDLIIRYAACEKPLAIPCILSNYYVSQGTNTITNSESLDDALSCLNKKHMNIFGCQEIPKDILVDQVIDGRLLKASSSAKPADDASLSQTRKSIVLVSYNIKKILKECVNSIINTVDTSLTDIYIIDNNSNDETKQYLKEIQKQGIAKVIFNGYNAGFTYAVNQGIELSNPKSDIILINNDAIATPGWLNALENAAYSDKNIGISAPQQVLLPNTDTMQQHTPFCNVAREVDVTISYHHDNLIDTNFESIHKYVDVSFVPFFCVYIKRDLIEKIGLLDADLGRHYRSDRLYCSATTQYAKKRIVYTPDAKLYHLHQQSTKELKKNNLEEYDKMYIRNSWGDSKSKTTNIWE